MSSRGGSTASSSVLSPLTGLFSSSPAIVPPKQPVDALKPEHFSADPSSLRFPATLDFKSANFKLRTLDGPLSRVRESAPREIDLTLNELQSLTPLNRFQQLRVLNACGNSLVIGGGVVLRLPRLQELDLSGNRLVSVPPLNELPQLQVLAAGGKGPPPRLTTPLYARLVAPRAQAAPTHHGAPPEQPGGSP